LKKSKDDSLTVRVEREKREKKKSFCFQSETSEYPRNEIESFSKRKKKEEEKKTFFVSFCKGIDRGLEGFKTNIISDRGLLK